MTLEEFKKIEIPLGNAKNLSNQKFGKLQPLFRVYEEKKDKTVWCCKCDCGEFIKLRADSLMSGIKTDCGKHIQNDLTNQVFGELTALYPVSIRNKNSHVWHCRCSCGEEIDVKKSHLLNKSRTRCDTHNERDLIGEKYNLLTVISFSRYIDGKTYYNCICDCGNKVEVNRSDLVTNNNKSCGCLYHKHRDLSNLRFGKLVAKTIDYNNPKTKKYGRTTTYWNCTCDCGNSVSVPMRSLISGETSSCGCLTKSRGELLIEDILKNNNIDFISQKRFDSCKFPDTQADGIFDFYINENKQLIEFDGEQHFGYTCSGWTSKERYVNTHNHDLYKNQWAWDNQIPMKRIPYTERDTLSFERIMSDEFLITPQTHPEWYPSEDSTYPYFTLEDIDKLKEVS